MRRFHKNSSSVAIIMTSTWDLGRDNFYVTLTNESKSGFFSENHPGEFRVNLGQNLLLDSDDWEVCLSDIHYVHDFPNIGESTFIKFRHRGEVFTLKLPKRFCNNMDELTRFLTETMNDALEAIYYHFREEKNKTQQSSQKSNLQIEQASGGGKNDFGSPSSGDSVNGDGGGDGGPHLPPSSGSGGGGDDDEMRGDPVGAATVMDQETMDEPVVSKDPPHEDEMASDEPQVASESHEVEIVRSSSIASAVFLRNGVAEGGYSLFRNRGGALKKMENPDAKKEVRTYEWGVTPPKIVFSRDPLDRLMISFQDSDFDVAFSDDLFDMLGLSAEAFTVSAFDARTLFLAIVEDACEEEGRPFYRNNMFGDFTLHGQGRALFNVNEPLLGFENLEDLRDTLRLALGGLRNFDKLFQRFVFNFDVESVVFESHGASMQPISAVWPAGYDAANFIKPSEYRKFIEDCQKKTVSGLGGGEKEGGESEGGFFSKENHAVFFAAFIVSKIFFGILGESKFVSKTSGRVNPFELLYIYTDLIKPDPFNEMMSRILTVFQTHGGDAGKMVTFSPTQRQYKPLDKNNISNITILIASDKGERVPFQRGPSVLTLHFRRRSYFRRR